MQINKKVSFLSAALTVMLSCFIVAPVTAQTSCQFSSVDADSSEALEPSEFTSAINDKEVYSNWDEQGLLIEEEWNRGFQQYYSGYDNRLFGDFSDWDLNEDGQITEEEFEETFFGMMDSNDDEVIKADEWDRYSKYICN